MNQITISGNLTADFTRKTTEVGREWSLFTIANNTVYFNKAQEKIEKVTFIDIVCSKSGLQEYVKKYAFKGAFCLVLGRLEIVKTDKDGAKYTNVRIVADELHFSSSQSRAASAEISNDNPFI